MHQQAPNGYYCEDLIVYGGLNRGCQVTQGFEIFTPDLRHASNAARVGAHDALMQLLSAFTDLKQIQFRWEVDSDYSEALLRYQQETEKAENVWSKTCRNERFYRYMNRMRHRELRRERLHLFLTTEIKTRESLFISRSHLRERYHKEFLSSRCNSVFLPMSPLAPVTIILLMSFSFFSCFPSDSFNEG
ncbi:MAG TPA: hypothetical protein VGC39_05465 [Candidatus Methylacidiphilales bacterium]